MIPPRCEVVESCFMHDLAANESVANLALELESEKGRVLALAFQRARQDGPASLRVENADVRRRTDREVTRVDADNAGGIGSDARERTHQRHAILARPFECQRQGQTP